MAIPSGQIGVGGLFVPTFLDSAGNPGKVVRLDDVEGAQDAVPTYVASAVTYDAAGENLDLTVPVADPADVAEFYLVIPAGLPRSADDLTITVNGDRERPFHMPSGVRAKARDLTPGCLHILLRHFAGTAFLRYTLADMPGPRPQDYDLIVARVLVSTPDIQALQAILDAGARYQTNEVVSPPDVAGQNSLFFGVPADAPDIDNVVPHIPLGITTYSVQRNTFLTTLTIDGVLYKWWYGVSWVAGAALRVIFAPYA